MQWNTAVPLLLFVGLLVKNIADNCNCLDDKEAGTEKNRDKSFIFEITRCGALVLCTMALGNWFLPRYSDLELVLGLTAILAH